MNKLSRKGRLQGSAPSGNAKARLLDDDEVEKLEAEAEEQRSGTIVAGVERGETT